MHRQTLLLLVMLVPFAVAVARDEPRLEVFGGYSWVSTDILQDAGFLEARKGFSGWNAALAWNTTHNLGFVAETTGFLGSPSTPNGDARTRYYSFLIGPKITHHNRSDRVEVFVQQLFGIGHATMTSPRQSLTASGFSMAAAFGMDFVVRKHWAIRPFEVDYVIDQMVNNTAQSQFRVSAGVVYRWSFANRKNTAQSFLPTAQPGQEIPAKPSDNHVLAIIPGDAENRRMPDDQAAPAASTRATAFAPGVVVLVTLSSPREKFWGVLLEVSPAGISLRGLDLNSFEDFVHLVRSGEPASPAAVFFPMHRVERMEADEHSGDIPSLKERFQEKTGRPLAYLFGRYGE